jgi:hypothetical protein
MNRQKFFCFAIVVGLFLQIIPSMDVQEYVFAENQQRQKSDNQTVVNRTVAPKQPGTQAVQSSVPFLFTQQADVHQKLFEFTPADPQCKNFNITLGTNGKGPTGRDNKILAWGYNQNVYGDREATDRPSLAYYLETFYEQPNKDAWMETYVQYVPAKGGTTIRPFMTSINRETGQTNSLMQFDYLSLENQTRKQMAYIMTNGIHVSNPDFSFYKLTNNKAFLYQKLAGTSETRFAGFYLDSNNNWLTENAGLQIPAQNKLGVGIVPAATLHVNGNEQHLITTVTGGINLDNHHTVLCSNATEPFQVTLPPASVLIAGRQYTIKNIGAAAVTVSGASKTELIDGSATRVLAQWAAITVQCGTTDGKTYQWFITARN